MKLFATFSISSGDKAHSINMNNTQRINQLKPVSFTGPTIYWMSREQRVQDNWSLIYAQQLANEQKQQLIVFFYLHPINKYNPQHYLWMLTGLAEVSTELEKLNIPFIVTTTNPEKSLVELFEQTKAANLFIDMSPLHSAKKRTAAITAKLKAAIFEVDARNSVPVWEVLDKQAYAASSIRARLVPLLLKYFTDYPQVFRNNFQHKYPYPDFKQIVKQLNLDTIKINPHYPASGTKAARLKLVEFLKTKAIKYEKNKNNPLLTATSGLSAYLHFGQISSLRVLLEYKKAFPETNIFDKKIYSQSFLDEIIVRKELAENYCYYNENYDNLKGAAIWARNELERHKVDERAYLYSFADLENAETHDELWNTCQKQLEITGYMPGYLRMYWAKKVLEWTKSPDEALAFTIKLNDYYSLDGRDPNGYAGIQWAITGLHDHPWQSRKIFGEIRYMSQQACARQFNIEAYIKQKQLLK